MSTSPVTFRNVSFIEDLNGLIIQKTEKQTTTLTFGHLVQSKPCADLEKNYYAHLNAKLTELQQFNPTFSDSESSAHYQKWKDALIIKLQGKLDAPRASLQAKVAKTMEELFTKNGERKIILGCMHIKQGTTIFLESGTPPESLLPKTDPNPVAHGHPTSVTIDWRVGPEEEMIVPIGDTEVISRFDFPTIKAEGPDFARRNLSITQHLDDFSAVERVDKISAERVPVLEKGIAPHINLNLLEHLFYLLSPGGRLGIDCGFYIQGLDCSGKDIKQQCHEKNLEQLGPEMTKELFDMEINEISQNTELLTYFQEGIEKKIFSALGLVSPKADPTFAFNRLKLLYCARKAQDTLMRSALETARKFSIDNLKKDPTKALLTSGEVYLSFESNNEPGSPKLFSLDQIRQGYCDDVFKQMANDLSDPMTFTIQIRLKNPQEPQASFDLFHQLECWNALHANPENAQYLLPENKALLDEIAQILVGKILLPQFALLNFVPDGIEFGGIHPENGRTNSRIMYVKRPEDPSIAFKRP